MQIITVLLNPAIDRVIEVVGLTLGKHLPGRLKARYPAGKAVNVSRCLAVLGHPSIATGFVGQGEVDFYKDFIRRRHNDLVQCRFVSVCGWTRENITLIDRKPRMETHIRDAGFTVTQADVGRLRRLLEELVSGESLVCFCGSLPPGVDDDSFLSLVDQCLAAEAKVVIDSSGPHMKEISKKAIWLVKPNVEELEEMVGYRLENESQIYRAARNLNDHLEIVLITAGENGAFLMTRGGGWRGHLALPPEEILNTVGCGDSLLGGFLAGVVGGLDHGEALRWGIAAAAANALSESAAGFRHSCFTRLLDQARVLPSGAV